MKEYGADLEQQLKDNNMNRKSIEGKIMKRMIFLVKQLEKKTELELPITLEKLSNTTDTNDLLFWIKKIEKQYVEKTKQIELFN